MEFGTKLWLHDVSDYHRVLDALDSKEENVFKDRICYTDFFFDFIDHSLTSSQAVLRLRVPFATEYSPTISSPIHSGNNFDEYSYAGGVIQNSNREENNNNNNNDDDDSEYVELENDNTCTNDCKGDGGRSINEYCTTLLQGVNRHHNQNYIYGGNKAQCWSNVSGEHRTMLINQITSSSKMTKGNTSLKRNRAQEELQFQETQERMNRDHDDNENEAVSEAQKCTIDKQTEGNKYNDTIIMEEEEEEFEHVEPAELVYKSGNTVGDGEQMSFTIKSKNVPHDVVQRLLNNTNDPFSVLAEYACSISTNESLDTTDNHKIKKKNSKSAQTSCAEKESILEIVNKLCELAPSKKKCNTILENLLTKHNECANTGSMPTECVDKSENVVNSLIELERCSNFNEHDSEEYDWILIPVGSYTTTRKVYECRLPLTNNDKNSWECTKVKKCNNGEAINDFHEATESYLTVRVDKTIFPFGERYEMESLPSSQLLNDVKEMLEAFLTSLHVKFTPASESKYVRFVIGNASRSAPQQEVQDVKLRITSKEGYDEMRDNLMSSEAFTKLVNRAKFCNNSSYATQKNNYHNETERRRVMSNHAHHNNVMSNRYTNTSRSNELAPFAENRAANYHAEYNANDSEEQNYINNKNTIAILKNKLNYTSNNTSSDDNIKKYETKEEERKGKWKDIGDKWNKIYEETTELRLMQLQKLEELEEGTNTQGAHVMKPKITEIHNYNNNINNKTGDDNDGNDNDDDDENMMTFEEEYHEDFFFDGSHHELAAEHGFLRLRRFGHGQFYQLVLKRKQKFVEGKQENYTCKTQVGEDVALLLLSGNPTKFLVEQHSCNAVAEMLWNSCGLRMLIPTVHFATHRLIVPWWSAECQVPTLARDDGIRLHNNKHTSNSIMAHSTRSVNTLNTCSIAMQTSLTSETLNYLNTQHSQTSEPLSLSQNTNVVEPLRIHLDRTIYEIPVTSNEEEYDNSDDNGNDVEDAYINHKRKRSIKEMSEEIKRSIDRNMQIDFYNSSYSNNKDNNDNKQIESLRNKTEIVEYEMPSMEESENAQNFDLHGVNSVNVMKSKSVSHASLQPTQISPVPRRVRSESVTRQGDSANASQSPQPVQISSQPNELNKTNSHNLHVAKKQATRTVELFELEVTNITHTTPSEVMNELVSKLYKLGIEWNPGTESKLDYYYHLPNVEHVIGSIQRSYSIHANNVEENNNNIPENTYKSKRQISVTLRASTQRV